MVGWGGEVRGWMGGKGGRGWVAGVKFSMSEAESPGFSFRR